MLVKDDSNLLDDNGTVDLEELLKMNNPALMMSSNRMQNHQRPTKKEEPPSNTQALLRDELAELEQYDHYGIEDQLVDEGGHFIYGTSGAIFSDGDIFESRHHQTQDEEVKDHYHNR